MSVSVSFQGTPFTLGYLFYKVSKEFFKVLFLVHAHMTQMIICLFSTEELSDAHCLGGLSTALLPRSLSTTKTGAKYTDSRLQALYRATLHYIEHSNFTSSAVRILDFPIVIGLSSASSPRSLSTTRRGVRYTDSRLQALYRVTTHYFVRSNFTSRLYGYWGIQIVNGISTVPSTRSLSTTRYTDSRITQTLSFITAN